MDLCKAIHTAVLKGDSLQVIDLLAADPTYCEARNNFGWTPLHTAAYALQEKIARILLRSGADPNALDLKGNSPLQLARQVDPSSTIVRLLSGEKISGEVSEQPVASKSWWKRLFELQALIVPW